MSKTGIETLTSVFSSQLLLKHFLLTCFCVFLTSSLFPRTGRSHSCPVSVVPPGPGRGVGRSRSGVDTYGRSSVVPTFLVSSTSGSRGFVLQRKTPARSRDEYPSKDVVALPVVSVSTSGLLSSPVPGGLRLSSVKFEEDLLMIVRTGQ